MDTRILLRMSYLELIFRDRNKSYGSYQLRLTYSERMRTAGLFLLGLAVLISLYTVLTGRDTRSMPQTLPANSDTIMLTNVELDIPEEPLVLPPEPKTNPNIKTARYALPQIVSNDMVSPDEMLATQEDLKDAVASNLKQDGDYVSLESAHIIEDAPLSDRVQLIERSATARPAMIETFVEQMPHFPGGEVALRRFLQENLRYPGSALKAGKQGKVYVKFVVNEDGSVTNILVVRSFGFGSDEEAQRVIAAMPAWVPGRNNGKPVKVWFQLPIDFRLEG